MAIGLGSLFFGKQRGGRTGNATTCAPAVSNGNVAFSPVSSDALAPAGNLPKTFSVMPVMPNKPIAKQTEYAMARYLEFKSPQSPRESLTIDLPLDGSFKNLADPSRPALRYIRSKGTHLYVEGVRGKALRLISKRGICNSLALPEHALNNDSGTITMWIRNGVALGTGWGLSVIVAKHFVFKWSEHLYRWRLNMFGGGPHTAYSMPNRHEWLHFAIVWDRKRKFQRLYLDGRLTDYSCSMSLPENAPATPEPIALHLTVGHPDRYLDIDEFKVYDRALSSSEIKAMVEKASPVIVPLQNVPESYLSVFAPRGETKTFRSKVVLNGKKAFKGTLKLETLDAEDKRLWTKNVEFSLSPNHKETPLEWKVPIDCETNDIAYIKATLTGYETSPAWSVEITRVPETHPVANLNGDIQLGKRVVDINCAARPSSGTYLDNCGAKVVSTKIGKYRETPRKAASIFSYKFEIEKPGWPHILRVTYPDDKPRLCALDLNTGGRISQAPQGAGIQTGYMTRLTHTMKTQDVLFWPVTTHCLLTACNWGDLAINKGSVVPFYGETAALAKIEVFELEKQRLPSLGMIKQKGKFPRRDVGVWIEDSSLEHYWCRGVRGDKKTLLGWALGAQRFAEYMDYIGADMLQYPVVWYNGPLFQSPTLMRFGVASDRLENHPKGVFAAISSTFASRGMKFFPIFYFRELAAMLFQTSYPYNKMKFERTVTKAHWSERYRTRDPGGDEIFQYYWNGKFKTSPYGVSWAPFLNVAPVFNPIHPKVLKIERGMFKDWIDAYANNPGFAGIHLDLGVSWGGLPQADSLSFGRIYGGYGDYTVGLFEKETGIKVPGEPGDPNKCGKRYKFLTSGGMRKKWIDWRCRQIRDKVVMPLFRMLRSKRRDLVLQIGLGASPDVGLIKTGTKISWNDAAKECGIDVDMYKNIPGITFVRHGTSFQNVTKCYPCDNLSESWPLDNNIHGGVCSITSSYWEMHRFGNLMKEARKKWPETQPSQGPVRTMVDAREGILALTAYTMMKKDVGEIYIGGMGYLATFGHENIVRPFFRAFRSLPKVKFDDIAGLEDPVRGRQKTVAGATYAYLVNAEPYAISVDLTFSAPPGDLVRLGTLERSVLKTTSLTLDVPPYQMVAMRFDENSKITSGAAHIPPKEIEAIVKWKNELKAKDTYPIMVHVPEKTGKHYIWFEAEDWNEWKSKKHSSGKGCRSIDRKNIKFISGNDDIGMGGDGIPIVYKRSCPKPGRYTLWVRYTAPTLKKPTKWKAKIDGKIVGQCKTPVDWKNIWTKVGEGDVSGTRFTMEWFHQVGLYASPVDCFLLTDDPTYVPKGSADYEKRKRSTSLRYGELENLIKKGHLAKTRALLTVLKRDVEK